MGARTREPAKIPISDLIEAPLVAGLALGALVIVALLPKLLAFPALAGLGYLGVSRTLARRTDLAFLVDYLGLRRELGEIEATRRQIEASVSSLVARGARGPVVRLPEQLSQLTERAYSVAVAIKGLEDGRQLADVDQELKELDLRIAGCRVDSEREHLAKARSHLVRERLAILKLDEMQRRLGAQLTSIYQFFRSADTDVRAISARYLAGSSEREPELVAETKELLDTIRDVDTVLAELDHRSPDRLIEAAGPDERRVERTSGALDIPAIVGAALDRLGFAGEKLAGSREGLLGLLEEIDRGGEDGVALKKRLLELVSSLAAGEAEPLDRRGVFLEMIRAAVADGRVVPEENRFLVRLAATLGLDRKECEVLAKQAKKERGQGRASGAK